MSRKSFSVNIFDILPHRSADWEILAPTDDLIQYKIWIYSLDSCEERLPHFDRFLLYSYWLLLALDAEVLH